MKAKYWLAPALVSLMASAIPAAQTPAPGGDVTFTKDIAPILQRSCLQCHNPDGGAPMSLTTYEEVRPWARAMKARTGVGPHAGVMPPWFVEKNIGIQRYKGDPSLSNEEITKIAKWADSGDPAALRVAVASRATAAHLRGGDAAAHRRRERSDAIRVFFWPVARAGV